MIRPSPLNTRVLQGRGLGSVGLRSEIQLESDHITGDDTTIDLNDKKDEKTSPG